MKRKKTIHIPIDAEETGRDEAQAGPGEAPGEKPGAAAEPAPEDRSPVANRDDVQEEIEGTRKELSEAMNHLQRLQAEFENYRKRTERERAESGDRAQAELVERLLPAIDDLDRAADAVNEDEAGLVKGFLLVRDKIHRLLGEAGLERIPAVGEAFDPNLHEALLTEAVEPDRAGTVLEELVAGYRFRDRVVRPSRVKVGVEEE